MLALIAVLVVGTLVEKWAGASFAQSHIYHSWWFMTLWILLLSAAVVTMVKSKLYRRWQTLLLHAALGLIVVGMIITTLTAKNGRITLEKGRATSEYVERGTQSRTAQLPFAVELLDFEVVTYPGTQAPQDFCSEIRFVDTKSTNHNATVSMNHIAKHRGYRFYQTSYNLSGQVTLTVAHDPWGITLNYIGYALLFLSFILFIFDKNSRFRVLLAEMSKPQMACLLGFLLLIPQLQAAHGTPLPKTLPKESAEQLGRLYVMYNDRVCPLQTLAKDFTTKLYGAPSYKGLTSEQVLSGWIFYFSEWSQEPMIKVKGDAVRETLGVQGKYARLTDFVDPQGAYRLENGLALPSDNPLRSKFLAADEKYNLVTMLFNGQLLKIFPVKDSLGTLQWCSQSGYLPETVVGQEYVFIRQYLSYAGELALTHDYATFDELMRKTVLYQKKQTGSVLPSDGKICAERWSNRLGVGRPMAMGCVLLGLLLFGYALFCMARKCASMNRFVRIAGIALLGILTLYLLLLFVLRWIVAGHVPMANGYETMSFLALCISCLALLLSRRHLMALPFGMLLTGFALLVAMLGGANPSVTPLMPVLSSPLLCIHVAIIMLAYALLAFVMLNSLAAVVLSISWHVRKQPQQTSLLQRLSIIGQLLLYPAVFLLAIGIFVGAIWANVSWGTYWSWDPKEVWALITLMVYAIPLHRQFFPNQDRPLRFHLYAILAFLCVLITYFGVNLILGGMHSYA